jgi:hypothetical protein
MMLTRLFLIAFLAFAGPLLAHANGHTNVQSVFLILMENVTWSEIKGSANAPFINSVLLPMASYCDNFFTAPNTSGSLPQYLWLEAGTNFGINDSADPGSHHVSTTNHLVAQLERAGISWKAYEENINGTNCPLTSTGLYAAYHNPFIYFDNIYLNPINCSNHIRPYLELAGDLTNGTSPRYCFITPNLCSDMHNSTGCATTSRVRNGDNWLATEIPRIMSSPAYTENGAIIITWDEGTGGAAGPYGTIVLSPLAKGGGYHNSTRFDHASTLGTLQEIFGVRPFLYAANNAVSLSDLFKPIITIGNPTCIPKQVFQFSANGLAPGKINIFQRSTNLLDWVNLLTNTVNSGTFNFADSNISNVPQGYYRVTEQP